MKKIVITGASSGIGKQLVQKFHDNNWFVIMVARNQENLSDLNSQLENSTYYSCDLSNKEEVMSLGSSLKDEHSDIDALINNAGIYRPQAIEKDEDSVWDEHYQSNLLSAIRMTRIVWQSLKSRKGCILNISSTLAMRPIPNTAAYSALKAAMNNWTLSLALEGAPHGIKANAICPGIIDTPIHSYFDSQDPKDQELYQTLQKAQPLGRTGKPKDVAGMAYQLCSEDSQWITGTLINIDGGILLNS